MIGPDSAVQETKRNGYRIMPVRKADNLRPSCAVVTKSGNLNFFEPLGPSGPVTGLLYLYLYRIMTWKLVIHLYFIGYCCLYRPRVGVGCSDV